METKSEVQKIEILTDSQIPALPDTVKENVIFLTETVSLQDLAILNPILTRLQNIVNDSKELVFVSLDDKESIDKYKSVKSSIGSFNSTLKKSATILKKNLKKPYQAVIDIEKTFKSLSDEINNSIKDTFKDYEDEVTRKKEEAQKKKDKALQDKIDEANLIASKAQDKNKISEVYNYIKYTCIAEEIINNDNQLVIKANEETLKTRLYFLENEINFGSLIESVSFDILDVEVQAELRSYFSNSVHNSIVLIKDKLKSIKTERDLLVSKTANLQEAAKQTDAILSPGEIPLPPNEIEVYNPETFSALNDKEFIMYIMKKTFDLKKLISSRIKTHGTSKDLLKLAESLNTMINDIT